jgi:hypothetical protein
MSSVKFSHLLNNTSNFRSNLEPGGWVELDPHHFTENGSIEGGNKVIEMNQLVSHQTMKVALVP